MPRPRPLKTDFGTVLLHTVLAIAFTLAALTGLRLAGEQIDWLRLLDPMLPSEDVWFRHLVAGVVLASALAAYGIYVKKAHLFQRIRLDWPRLTLLRRSGPNRWAVVNVLLLWLFFLAVAIEIVTGTALFFGAGGRWTQFHLQSSWACILFPFLHVTFHAAHGGTRQLMRIARPALLPMPPPPPDFAELLAEHLERSEQSATDHAKPGIPSSEERLSQSPLRRLWASPLARGAFGALLLGAIAIVLERYTRPVLHVSSIASFNAPIIDGELSDPVWASARMMEIRTRGGANLGGIGESLVEIRAVHDARFAYFAFTWADPTRSLKYLPLVKRQDGWHLIQTAHDKGDENQFYEDKFAILLASSSVPLIGAAIHLAIAPLSHKPPSFSGRGLHFTKGGVADVLLWRASHGGLVGRVENCHFGPPAPATPAQIEGQMRYAGGFAADPEPAAAYDNFKTEPAGGYRGAVQIRRLPRSPQTVMAALGRIDGDATHSESLGAHWWMTEAGSIPYSAAADRAVPIGSVMPGAIITTVPDESVFSVRGQANWSAGRWTLELVRPLDTHSQWDVPIRSGVSMWVAVFDHAETRHTWHLRPLRLEIE